MLKELLVRHIGKVIGTSFGMLLGFIYLFFGLLQTMVFALLVGAGYSLGKKYDRKEEVKDVLDRLWSKKDFGRW